MFKCGECKQTTQPHEKAHRIVVETRMAVYPARKNAHADGKDDPGGSGLQVVREIMVCESCFTAKQIKED